jgi:hypothetical protein
MSSCTNALPQRACDWVYTYVKTLTEAPDFTDCHLRQHRPRHSLFPDQQTIDTPIASWLQEYQDSTTSEANMKGNNPKACDRDTSRNSTA